MEDLNIRHFRLTNGDEILGLVAVNNESNWVIERPVLVNANLMGGFNFTPWFPFSEAKTFKILKTHIIQHVPVVDTVKSTYLAFVLKYQNDDQSVNIKSQKQSLDEYERELLEKYSDDDIDIEYTDEINVEKIIH